MDQEGFITTPQVAELFFRVCRRYGVNHPEDRLLLLRQLARRKKVRYIRDVSTLTNGKKVLRIGFKPKGDNQ
jgi:hypothetical protein